jgi:hypothetical protein
MAENHIYLIWSGHITQEVGKEVLYFTETKLTEDDIESNLRKRVFSILVEIIENIAKFSPGREAEEKFGKPVAMIRLKNMAYYLTTGNLILNENIAHLRNKLETINSYDKDGLRDLFIESLSHQRTDMESTGNMGLIEIARKSGNKLEYNFDMINDLYSYYTLTVMVEGNVF